jgi:hypothetical protein
MFVRQAGQDPKWRTRMQSSVLPGVIEGYPSNRDISPSCYRDHPTSARLSVPQNEEVYRQREMEKIHWVRSTAPRKCKKQGSPSVANLFRLRSSLCILLGPFPGRGNSLCLVFLPRLSYIVRERVVRVGCAEEGLDGEKDGPDLQCRRPVA